MPYLIDRQRALFAEDIIAVLALRQRRARSRVVLRDNSLCQTLTRPQTLLRRHRAGRASRGVGPLGTDRRRRARVAGPPAPRKEGGRDPSSARQASRTGAIWWIRP
jgi:hypothetical protein